MRTSKYLAIAWIGVGLAASAPAATPKGDYVLLDQGVAAGQSFVVLGTLALDGAGNAKGIEVFRSGGASIVADVKGVYAATTANSGTLILTATPQGVDEPESFTQSYRYLITDDNELYAVRTDNGVLSTSTLTFANAAPNKGSLALNELDRDGKTGQASALLAQLGLDGNGAVSGKAFALRLNGTAEAAVSGTYTAPASGLGVLELTLTTKEDDGNEQTAVYRYRTAATRDGVKAIRMDPGVVAIANIEIQ